MWWHACVAAKTVQRMWRQWRHRPPVSVAALAKQAASAEDDSDRPTVQEAEEEDDLVDAPRNRALDSLFARQFPQFSAVLESHREGRGTYQEEGSCSAKVVAERIKRLDNMGVRLIWITTDLCLKNTSSSKKAKAGNKWKQSAKKAGAKGTIGEVLAAAKAEAASGTSSAKPSARSKSEPQGGDEGANKMACHFFRKGEPLVALRYLQQDAHANGAGFVDSEYKLAVNLGNTASIFVQPPICNKKRFDEAVRFTDRAIQTLNSHAETATLANAGAKASVRRMELAVCVHNVGVHLMYAGRAKEAWNVLEEAHKCLGSLPADLRKHAYNMAIAKTFAAMEKLSMSMGIGAGTQAAAEDADVEVADSRGSGGASLGKVQASQRRRKGPGGSSSLAAVKLLKVASSSKGRRSKEPPVGAAEAAAVQSSSTERSVKFIVSESSGTDSGTSMLPVLNSSSSSSSSTSATRLLMASSEVDKPRNGPGPIAKLQQKMRESKQDPLDPALGLEPVKGAEVQSMAAKSLLSSMTLLTRAMVAKPKG